MNRALLFALFLFSSTGLAEDATISTGISHSEFIKVAKALGAQDISSGMEIFGKHDELYWEIKDYDIVIQSQFKDGKLSEFKYWKEAEFNASKVSRIEHEKCISALHFDTAKKQVIADAATLVLDAKLLRVISPETQTAMPKTAAEVTALIQSRWTVDNIQEYCRPETRTPPMTQNLGGGPPGTEIRLEDTVYKAHEKEIGKVSWYAFLAKDFSRINYSLNVEKNGDHWIVELGDFDTLKKPLTKADCFENRIAVSAFRPIRLTFFDSHGRFTEKEAKELLSYYEPLVQAKVLFEYDPVSKKPKQMSATLGEKLAGTSFVVVLNDDGEIDHFIIDGQRNEFWDRMYKRFRENYSKWLNEE